MIMQESKYVVATVAAVFTLGIAITAQAWEPTKPIKIIVGYAPGGGADMVARNLVASSQEFFPVPLVVVNKAGAAGALAADAVKNEKADGYTLLLAGGSESTTIPNFQKVTYSLDDFRGVLRCIRQRVFLFSKADSGIKNIADLKAKALANPGKLSFGSSGQGSLYHAIMLATDKTLGIDLQHVPYKGGAPMMAALLGNHIDISLGAPEEIGPQVDAGQVTLLALASDSRFDVYKDVPTLRELGYDIYIENQKGIFAAAGTPDDVVKYFHDNFKKGLDSEVWKAMAVKLSMETAYLNGDDFMKAVKQMSDTIGEAVKGLEK